MFTDNSTLDLVFRGLALTAMGMVWIVLLVRIVGLRSFSKMTNFDFVMTVAMGSLLAGSGQSTSWTEFAQTLVAMTALFAVQWLVARLRKTSDSFEQLVQNEPIILMRNGAFDEAALRKTRVAKDDLIAKLREANVLALDRVQAVILETTGDVSVLHGEGLEDALLAGVRRSTD
ncbi:MAG: YetF domain-containing protein [Parvularcula sp.]|jgi:uncharacterized membrane protein YcaP (DUF421 family)|nr:YetF domain-containing protein [Parvularcula sp.]